MMKKRTTIILVIMSMIFLVTNISSVSAYTQESTQYWFKGHGIAYGYTLDTRDSISDSEKNMKYGNFEWAVVSTHAYYVGTGQTANERVRVYSREESPTYIYPNAVVRTLRIRSGFQDYSKTYSGFAITKKLPNETSVTLIPSYNYQLLTLLPVSSTWASTIAGAATVLDALSNVTTSSIKHWEDINGKNGNVQGENTSRAGLSNMSIPNSVATPDIDAYANYLYDISGGQTARGFTGSFTYDFGGFTNYAVRAWGQVLYRVQTEYGNGITYEIATDYPEVTHLVNNR